MADQTSRRTACLTTVCLLDDHRSCTDKPECGCYCHEGLKITGPVVPPMGKAWWLDTSTDQPLHESGDGQ